eukprot:contig_24527_g6043
MSKTNGASPPLTAPPTDAVLEQYDTAESAQFYSVIMGDDTAHVHYGVFSSPSDTTRQAAAATTTALRTLAEDGGVVFRRGVRVLDLGAGNGGAAHALAAATGCSVTCLNLCGRQNAANEAAAAAAGLDWRALAHGYDATAPAGSHVAVCGHALHVACWERYAAALRASAAVDAPYEGRDVADLTAGEYLCPVCRRLANTLLPV